MSNICPFCVIPADRLLRANEVAFVIADRYPVAPGHALVIPKRHVKSVFDLSADEQSMLWRLVIETRRSSEVNAFNIGINDGFAAGQTVEHAHIHVIPRHAGDIDDPRGGVRWIIPSKAKYW